MFDKNKKKKGTQFTILSNDSTDGHGGFGVGTLSLNDVSPVIVDLQDEKAYVDMGALHAKSEVEKRVKFLNDKDTFEQDVEKRLQFMKERDMLDDEVQQRVKSLQQSSAGGKQYWIVWVTVGQQEGNPYYAGVTACEMIIIHDVGRGYKNLADHVNKMDKSMKRQIIVDDMDDKAKQILADFLQNHNQEMWDHSSDELKQKLHADH